MRLLPDWIESFLEYTEATEPPLMFRKWTALSVIAAALQRKVWIEWGIDEELYANLYVVFVAPPGGARKGTAMKKGISLVRDLGIKLAPNSLTREQLIRELCESSDLTITSNNQYISHSSLTILSPELTVFLGYDNKTLISDLADWYDCADVWEYHTKTQGTDDVTGVWVNLLGATTPDLIRSALPLDTFGGGLASRIIFVYEERKGKTVPDPFKTPRLERLREALLKDLSSIHSLSGRFTIDDSYIDLWVPWYMRLEQTQPKMPYLFEGYLNRRQTHVRKISMVLCAARTDDMRLMGEDFTRAVALLEETEKKMARTFGGVGSAKSADITYAIQEYMLQHEVVKLSDIVNTFGYMLESERHLFDVLGLLSAQRLVIVERRGTETYVRRLHSNGSATTASTTAGTGTN